jgi:hypothetical protein
MHKVKACREGLIATMSQFSKYCTDLDEILFWHSVENYQ